MAQITPEPTVGIPGEEPETKPRNFVGEFCTATTCHGVINLYESKTWPWKIFWTLVIIFCFILIIYEIYGVVKQYVDNPISTKLERKMVESLEIPDMAFCPPHRINWTYAQENSISIELLEYIYGSILSSYSHSDVYSSAELVDLESQYNTLKASKPGFHLDDFFREGGLKCEHFVKSCMFEGKEVKKCCEEHMTEVLMHHGKCFLFNPEIDGNPASQKYGGPMHGISILFNLNPSIIAPTFHNSHISEALFMHIGHLHLNRFPVPMDNNPIMIPSGMHAFVSLEAQEFKYIDGYGCEEDEDHNDLRFFNGYERQACLYECILNSTLKYCGCVMMGYEVTRHLEGDDHICEPKQSAQCVSPNFFGDSENTFNKDVHKCEEGCTEVCDYWEYKPSIMLASYPAKTAEAPLRAALGITPVDPNEKEFVLLDIYFSRVSVSQTIQVYSSSIDTLVGSVGGQMGLFAGCSIVTLIHAIIFVCQRCSEKIKAANVKRNEKKQFSKTQSSKNMLDGYDSPPKPF